MWADETSTLTFNSACGGSGTANDDAVWTVSSDASESQYESNRGIHYGTSSAAVSFLQLTTSDIPGTITEITVNASGASGTSAKLNVTVGGEAFGSQQSLTSTANNYTFQGSASGEITVRLSQTSTTKALYVKKIEVTYSVNGSTTETLTFIVSSNPGSWPTENSTTLTNYSYTLDNVGYTFALKNVKCNPGYLMMTATAVLGLPAIEGKKLTKVVAKNSASCSTSTRVGVSSSSSQASYIAGGAYITWSNTSSSYTYNLTSTEANTVYYLYVTNKNAQVTELKLTYEQVAAPEPAINFSTNLVEATAAGADGTINVTYTAIDFTNAPEIVWYTDATATTTTDEPSWFAIDVDSDNDYNLSYLIDENTGAARTAYMKVYALDVNGEDVYSELITITQAAATLPITVSEAGWATFAPTQNVSFDSQGMSAYVVTNATTKSATLQSVSSVPANIPVLICAEEGTYALEVVDNATAPTTNLLQVSDGTKTGGASIYSLAKIDDEVGFYRVDANVTIPAGKCYLNIQGTPAQGNARAFLTLGGNTETGITTVAADAADGNIYDLTGRRVSGVARGLYIVNGKKVVLK